MEDYIKNTIQCMQVLHLLKIPDFVSLINLLFGMAAIFFAFNDSYSIAAACLLIAAAADGADGYIARKTSGGPLGEHIDSLVDTVSFGVAPAVLIYCMGGTALSILIVCFYLICGVLRLARYNAFPSHEPKYSGIPITGACVFIASFVLLFDKLAQLSIEIQYGIEFFYGLMFILSLLMISTVSYPKVMKKMTFAVLIFFFSATIISIFIENIYFSLFPGILCLMMLIYLFTPIIGLGLKKNLVKL